MNVNAIRFNNRLMFEHLLGKLLDNISINTLILLLKKYGVEKLENKIAAIEVI